MRNDDTNNPTRVSFIRRLSLLILVVSFISALSGCFMNPERVNANSSKPRLEVPLISVQSHHLNVTSRLKDFFSEELKKTLESGKQVMFQYHIDFYRTRFSFFPDSKVWSGTVTLSATYNTATREYTVEIIDENKKEAKYTENPAEMMEYVGTFHVLLPEVIKQKNLKKEHYVRIWVAADTGPLPGGFQTRTIYSKEFIPSRLLEEPKSQ